MFHSLLSQLLLISSVVATGTRLPTLFVEQKQSADRSPCLSIAIEVMFLLDILSLVLAAVSLSSGQNFTGGLTCNLTSKPYGSWDEVSASCNVTTCYETFRNIEECYSWERNYTCEPQMGCFDVYGDLHNNLNALGHGPSYLNYSVCQVRCGSQQSLQKCFCYHPPSEYMDSYLDLSNYLVWIGVGLVLLFLPIIIFFNINAASGPNHSCVFFYQCVPLASVYGSLTAALVMQNLYTIHDFRVFILEYCKHIIVVIFIFLTSFLVKCTSCPLQKCRLPWAKVRRAVRNFREKHIGSTFIHAICSIIVLSYGDLVAISMTYFIESVKFFAFNRTCCYHANPQGSELFPCDNPYPTAFRNIYLRHFIPSVVVLALLLLLPFSLIYYPSIPALFHKLTGRSLPRFPKLDPVFDVFQGVYKDKMRWFAGVHLLYLMILWAVYLCLPDVISFVFVLILAIHSLFQPFKNPKHNYLETLYLVYLSLMSVGNSYLLSASTALVNSRGQDTEIITVIISVFSYVLLFFPSFLVFVFCCYKILSKRVCCQRCVSSLKNFCSREDGEQESLFPEQHIQEEDPLNVVEWST